MKNKLEYVDGNAGFISLNGYAFLDESGHTIIIVYGEGRRDDMKKYLESDKDPLKIKYQIVNL